MGWLIFPNDMKLNAMQFNTVPYFDASRDVEAVMRW